jgi:LPXTG-motif cell wall-anchored protein
MNLYFDSKIRKMAVTFMMTAMFSTVITPSLSVFAMDTQQDTIKQDVLKNEENVQNNESENKPIQETNNETTQPENPVLNEPKEEPKNNIIETGKGMETPSPISTESNLKSDINSLVANGIVNNQGNAKANDVSGWTMSMSNGDFSAGDITWNGDTTFSADIKSVAGLVVYYRVYVLIDGVDRYNTGWVWGGSGSLSIQNQVISGAVTGNQVIFVIERSMSASPSGAINAWTNVVYDRIPMPNYQISANDYSIDIQEVFDGNNDILSLSTASVSDLNSLDNTAKAKIISGGDIPAMTGQYKVTLGVDNDSTGTVTKDITVTVTSDLSNVVVNPITPDKPVIPNYKITANDYSIDVKEVFNGNNDILALSSASVTDVNKVDNNAKTTIFYGGDVPAMTGEYEVTLGVDNDPTGKFTKDIIVTVTSDLSNVVVNPITPDIPVIPNYEITANDYTIDVKDVFEGKNDILTLSSAIVKDLNKVDDTPKVKIVDGEDIPAMTGEYEVTLGVDNDSTGKFTKDITVTVTGDLTNIDGKPITPTVPVIPKYEITANNFTVHIRDVDTVNIIDKSGAQASNANDSTDLINIEVKTPLKKEVGVQNITLGIDKDDSITTTIQVFVVDDSTTIQDRTVIYANDFTMKYKEKANLTSNQAKILANVKAYDVTTARDLTQDVTAHEQDLKNYIASTSLDKANLRFVLPVYAPRQQVNHSPVVEKAVVVTTIGDSDTNTSGNNNNKGNQNKVNTSKKASKKASNRTTIPKTGDSTSLALTLFGLALSSSCLGVLIYRNRK